MIRITLTREFTVDGQTVTERVELETEFPNPQEGKITELKEKVKQQHDRLSDAVERNKVNP